MFKKIVNYIYYGKVFNKKEMITRKSKNRLAKEVKIVIKFKKLKPHKSKKEI
jgi:hypothetical protein